MERFSRKTPPKGVPCVKKVLVLGGTGHGKSSLINTMRGEYESVVGDTWEADKSITKEIEEFSFNRNNKIISFIDTPALKMLENNRKFTELYKSGFDAVVVVYSIKSFSPSRQYLLKQVEKTLALKKNMGSYFLVAFTFADYLEDANLGEFLCTHKELHDFMQKYEMRYVEICNKEEMSSKKGIEQRNAILNSLEEIFGQNDQPLSRNPVVSYVKCIIGIIVTSLLMTGIGVLFYTIRLKYY